MIELDRSDYAKVSARFDALAAYNVSIPALLDGINPGSILVDEADHPQLVFMRTVEGNFLVGDPQDSASVAAFNAYLCGFYNDEVTVEGRMLYLDFYPDGWQEHTAALFQPRSPINNPRRHYVCTALAYTDWRERVPDGFSVRRIDDALLDDPAMDVPDHIREWIQHNWGSHDNYGQHGFGACTLHGNAVVSWSVADCRSGTRAEIGIHTRSGYRRQGLAAITAAAAVDYAFASGLTEVGWHCDADNEGSRKTAERVGFVHERDYASSYCAFSSVHHQAEIGYMALRTGHYADSVGAFEQLFAISRDYPDYVYHVAARVNAAVNQANYALAYLNVAIDRGWMNQEHTLGCAEFSSLRGTAGWAAALARMQA
jgi:RimJ/RimL family protein N-acetyltransferase